jgi:hypothetical protein
MTGAEIDLREKIADEIQSEIENLKLEGDQRWAMSKAIGVVRARIWHNPLCPCSSCGGKGNV